MRETLQRLLRAPEYADPADAEMAKSLHWLLLRTIGIAVALSVLILLLSPFSVSGLLISSMSALFMLAALEQLQRGQLRVAGIGFPLFVFVLSTGALFTYGLNGGAAMGYVLAVFFAGFFWSGGAAVALGIVGALLTLGYVGLAEAGLWTAPHAHTMLRSWLGIAASLAAASALVYIVFNSLRKALRDALRSDRAHRDSEKRLATTVSENPDGLITLDGSGVIRAFNPAAEQITGLAAASILGKSFLEAGLLPEEDLAPLMAAFGELRHGQDRPPTVLSIVRPNGERRWVEATGRMTVLEDGKVEVHAAMRDVSVRRKLEEQLHRAQRMEALGQLAGGVAHDFNNMLSVVMTNASFLLAHPMPEKERAECLTEIRDATRKAAGLTQQLLAFSRRQPLAPERVNVRKALASLERMLRRVIGEDISLTVHAGQKLHRVEVDRGQLEQAIMNLCVNARSAMPSGGSLVIATENRSVEPGELTEHGVKPGLYVLLTVKDDGAGMTPEVRNRVFEPFFTTKGPDEGTGLGLAMLHGFVEQSGGYVWVESAPDQGTTFYVLLPALQRGASHQSMSLSMIRPISKGDGGILLVEDEHLVRRTVSRALRMAGYSVTEAGTPEEALALDDDALDKIDLLISDVVMPKMSGPTLAEELVLRSPHLRVLFISGYAPDDRVLIPGVAFLPKPFTPEVLTQRVSELMQDQEPAIPN